MKTAYLLTLFFRILSSELNKLYLSLPMFEQCTLFLPTVCNFLTWHAQQLIHTKKHDLASISQISLFQHTNLALRSGFHAYGNFLRSDSRRLDGEETLQPFKDGSAFPAMLIDDRSVLGHVEDCPHAYFARKKITNF